MCCSWCRQCFQFWCFFWGGGWKHASYQKQKTSVSNMKAACVVPAASHLLQVVLAAGCCCWRYWPTRFWTTAGTAGGPVKRRTRLFIWLMDWWEEKSPIEDKTSAFKHCHCDHVRKLKLVLSSYPCRAATAAVGFGPRLSFMVVFWLLHPVFPLHRFRQIPWLAHTCADCGGLGYKRRSPP